ncbi:MAG: glycosyltransferase family 2 protein [Thermoplasmata archaeon]|nr:glycosyltransferase family 2 protein [Thermoplasmata archaeon]
MRATLVIPTLNEGTSIGHVIDTFLAAAGEANPRLFGKDPLEWEVVVVDGASTDGTAEIARKAGARVIAEPRKGYGRAYQTGFAAATGEVIATSDGDSTYPVEEIPRLVRLLLDAPLDFITCDRLTKLDTNAMTREHRVGNWVLNYVIRIAYHHYLRGAGGALADSQSGMWVFRRSILDRVTLTQDGMPFSEELKIEVLRNGLRFLETPIVYRERWGAPKLSSWRDGRHNLEFLIRKRIAMGRGGTAPPPGAAADRPAY